VPCGSAAHRLDHQRGLIGPDGADIPLRPKSLALLGYLARQAGRVVPRDGLPDAVGRVPRLFGALALAQLNRREDAAGSLAALPLCPAGRARLVQGLRDLGLDDLTAAILTRPWA
jgi:hypothetical protein